MKKFILGELNGKSLEWQTMVCLRDINDNTEKYLKCAIEHDFELVSHGWNHIDLTTLKSKNDIVYEIIKPIEEVKKV